MVRSPGYAYSFHDFQRDVLSRVRLLNRRLTDPDAVWPGVLILDAPDGLTADRFDIPPAGRARAHLMEVELPALILTRRARRFCWVMPVVQVVHRADNTAEYLLVLIGEPGRCEAVYAEVRRDSVNAPDLGRWNTGAFGRGSRTVAGGFVTPLMQALERLAENAPEAGARLLGAAG